MTDPEWLLDTCKAIAASRKVMQFVVGITTKPTQRRAAYRKWAEKKGGSLDGWVILEWGLSPARAVEIERHLFEGLVNDDGYGVIKMHYHPSVKPLPDQVVYLAWWSPWLISIN